MRDISIIGAGKVGTCLAAALAQKKFKIKAISCRSLSSAKESRKIIGQGKASTNNRQVAEEGQIVFICVPDDKIKKITKELSGYNLDWSGKVVLHCSGLHPAAILKEIKDKGASTASFHPLQSFPQKMADIHQFEGIYFGLEGAGEALSVGEEIAASLGARVILLRAQDKPAYHTACSFASNLLLSLLDIAESLLAKVDLQQQPPHSVLFPLVQKTIQNVKNLNTGQALTGPAARGDVSTIRKHLEVLADFPQYQNIYRQLTVHALQIAAWEKKIPRQKIKALISLLEDK